MLYKALAIALAVFILSIFTVTHAQLRTNIRFDDQVPEDPAEYRAEVARGAKALCANQAMENALQNALNMTSTGNRKTVYWRMSEAGVITVYTRSDLGSRTVYIQVQPSAGCLITTHCLNH
jgi:hypothetical protein